LLAGHGYTVRHVGFDVVGDRQPLALLRFRPDPRAHGGVLDFYAPANQDVVDDHALSVRPPLFPVVLALSVAALGSSVEAVDARHGDLRGAPARVAVAAALERTPPGWRRAQLPLVLPVVLASLGAVALAFATARTTGGSVLAASLAALALATAPLEVWCAHRVTADTLTEVLVGGATCLLAGAAGGTTRGDRVRIALAGVLGGLSVLAKPSGVLLLPAYAVAEAVLAGRDAKRPWREAALRVAIFGGALVVSGLWWSLYRLVQEGFVAAVGYGGIGYSEAAQKADWPSFTHGRPFWIVPASTVSLSPLLGIGAVGLAWARRERRVVPLAAIAALFVLLTMLWPARENRYLLPAYVAFAAGLAGAIDAALAKARRSLGSVVGTALVLLVPVALLLVSAPRAREAALSGAFEIAPIGPPAPGG
jgi:hypothetical protein